MKIIVNKRGSREFYDEMLYVVSYYKKFIKNPKKKAWQFSHYILMFAAICLVMLLAYIWLYLVDMDWYSLVFIGVFSVIILFMAVLYLSAIKKIKSFMSDTSEKTIEIENDYICLTSDSVNIKLTKDKIAVIIINKHSISILPREATQYAILISTDYLDDFLKGTSENGFDELIINNLA